MTCPEPDPADGAEVPLRPPDLADDEPDEPEPAARFDDVELPSVPESSDPSDRGGCVAADPCGADALLAAGTDDECAAVWPGSVAATPAVASTLPATVANVTRRSRVRLRSRFLTSIQLGPPAPGICVIATLSASRMRLRFEADRRGSEQPLRGLSDAAETRASLANPQGSAQSGLWTSCGWPGGELTCTGDKP